MGQDGVQLNSYFICNITAGGFDIVYSLDFNKRKKNMTHFNMSFSRSGLVLFLSGLDLLSDGLKKAAGDTLKTLLAKMTTNRFLGAITGAFITAVLNSSSVTTVLVVS